MVKEEPVDTAIRYLESISAKYLCKEDCITWFGSITGSDLDRVWHTMSLDQTKRVISYRFAPVSVPNIISALQEMNVVYDTAITSRYKCPPNILNYSSRQKTLVEESIVKSMFENLTLPFLLYKDYLRVITEVCEVFKVKTNMHERSLYIRRYAPLYGYYYYEGKDRLNYRRSKVTLIGKPNLKGKDLFNIKEEQITNLIQFTKAGNII